MGQLVEERGRLVDAVIEQASSTSPALAAELTRSLEVGVGGWQWLWAGGIMVCEGMQGVAPGVGMGVMVVWLSLTLHQRQAA
jgi:hypothetical protein